MLVHSQPTSGKFFSALDGIRGIAIILVVICHNFYANPNNELGRFMLGLIKSGHLGVQIFFVLSGYLISKSIFLKHNKRDVLVYITRRFSKIYPPLILSIAVLSLLVIPWKQYTAGIFFRSAILSLLGIPNFIQQEIYVNPVLWSLYCEILFYVTLPIIFLTVKKYFQKPDITTTLLFFVIPIIIRVFTWPEASITTKDAFFTIFKFPRFLDGFAYGMAFACIENRAVHLKSLIKYANIIASSGLLLFLFVVVSYGFIDAKVGLFQKTIFWKAELFKNLASIATFLMLFVVFVSEGQSRTILSSPLLVFTGLISYEWFLIHMPIGEFARYITGNANGHIITYIIATIIPSVFTYILAYVIYRFYSFPLMTTINARLSKTINRWF